MSRNLEGSRLSSICFVAGLMLAMSVVLTCSATLAGDTDTKLPPLGTLDVVLVRDALQSDDPVLNKQVRELFKARKFEDLESLADHLRKSKECYVNGIWRLSQFYNALSKPGKDENWQDFLSRFAAWLKKYPRSITAPVAYADAMVSYAWHARGSGWASSVTEQGWRLFGERVAQARSILETAAKNGERCPRWYKMMLLVGQAQSWTKSDLDKVFKEGLAAEPKNYPLYFQKANYLQERWFGDKGEWESFADTSARSLGGEDGDVLYARIVWFVHEVYDQDNLSNAKLDTTRLKRGFETLVKRFPDDLELKSEFASMAIIEDDVGAAHEMFKQMGNRVFISYWRTKRSFFEWRERAVDETDSKHHP